MDHSLRVADVYSPAVVAPFAAGGGVLAADCFLAKACLTAFFGGALLPTAFLVGTGGASFAGIAFFAAFAPAVELAFFPAAQRFRSAAAIFYLASALMVRRFGAATLG